MLNSDSPIQYDSTSNQIKKLVPQPQVRTDISEERAHIISAASSHSGSNPASSQHRDGAVEKVSGDHVEHEQRPGMERTTTNASSTTAVHSAFTKNQKRFIVFMASWAGFFSPVSGQIYFPALNALATDLKVSNTLINLTLTSYMIFQGLAPTFIGDLADTMGRRLAYAVCFVIYIAANIGLALQNSYAALFVLRCIQSSGSSGTIAMASGVVSDVATASERGSYMGYTLAGSLIGPAIGPVIGGILTQFLGWRAIFWFLTIMGSAFLVVFAVFFPETARNQVGNGSIPPKGYNMSLMNYLAIRKARKEDLSLTQTHSIVSPSPKFRFPNPLSSLYILWDKENALLLFYNAFLFAAFYALSAVIPSQFAQIYSFNDLQIGLCFIPFGFGSLCAALINGRLLDRNYRRWCKKLNVTIRKGRQQDLSNFPIEKARLQIAIPVTYITIALVLVFGWVLDIGGPLAVQLVILFFTALFMSISFNCTSTLLVDFYPHTPATATAANNLVRCWVGAGATAGVIPMVESVGRGWTFTALVAFLLLTSPFLWAVERWGMGWRQQRKLREGAATRKKSRRKEGEEGARETGARDGGGEKHEDAGQIRPVEGNELHRSISHHSSCPI